jgi:beta-glucosidase-like glycosyl hydrolase/CubicO group peptidase (beta-lactamase class C family)
MIALIQKLRTTINKKLCYKALPIVLVATVFFYKTCYTADSFYKQPLMSQTAVYPYHLSTPQTAQGSKQWVDSMYKTLNADQRIGQLFMVAAFSNINEVYDNKIANLITNHNVGGLIFMKGTPEKQAQLTNIYQGMSTVPLLISIDAEWGLSMRLTNTLKYPNQMTLGALQNNKLIYEMGKAIGAECARVGVNVSFSPVVDVNNNPNNPVINYRSFGEDKYSVADKAVAYMRGLQEMRILACAKHFPGHGDTDADSHQTLPTIHASRERLEDIELFPFRRLVNAGVGSVMIAHLFIPALDPTPNRASTLSPNIVNDLLKNDLDFKGLIFTDALNMKGVSEYYPAGTLDVQALIAGNDVLLYPTDVPLAIKSIKQAIKDRKLSWKEIEIKVKKILQAKYWSGLNHYQPVSLLDLNQDLNMASHQYLIQKIYQKALTLVKNKEGNVPYSSNAKNDIFCLSVGASPNAKFTESIKLYTDAGSSEVAWNADENTIAETITKATRYKNAIIGVHLSTQKASENYGIRAGTLAMIREISNRVPTTVVVFGNPYSLKNFRAADGLVCAYEDNPNTHLAAAQALFGATDIEGRLPISVDANWTVGTGIQLQGWGTMENIAPEGLGISANALLRIDSMAQAIVKNEAAPGCQIFAAIGNKIFYNKAFGYQTYEKNTPITTQTLYDLASITKVAASALAIMKLYEQKKLDINEPLVTYLPELEKTNKATLTLREILTHQAGLQAWIPFYIETIDGKGARTDLYKTQPEGEFTIPVAEKLFLQRSYVDTIYKKIDNSQLKARSRYLYSDLGYFYVKKIVEKLTGMPLNDYVTQNFYAPMGLQHLCFNPLKKYNKMQIAPTENDQEFRMQLLQGYVHDYAAAQMGGVAGHAGLFGNATDVGTLMYILLQKGIYGGKMYLQPDVVNEFTKQQYDGNRRGLCFDRPSVDAATSPTAPSASQTSFGHSGFTGTYVWIDPEYNFTYVFLSNRVYPTADNKKLITYKSRVKIQEAFYDAIKLMQQTNAANFDDLPKQ